MRQLTSLLIILSLSSISIIYAQVNVNWCQNGPITTPDPKWRTIPPRFEIITELVSGNELLEVSQAFAPISDAVLTSSKYGPIEFYWNFGTNETFQVLTAIIGQKPVSKCLRQEIGLTSQTSVIQPNSLYLKPSTLLGYDPRNKNNTLWGNQYIGDEELRGIPINKFKSCFYVSDIQATVSATYYVSDVTKFVAYLPRNHSIILQIDVTVTGQGGRQESYTYNVFRFSPNPSRQEERQAIETPGGVYCPNRTSTLATPANLPERVSTNSEALLTQANGSIFSTHALHDSEFQFSRFDVVYPDRNGRGRWQHYTEIHDFGTGLSYQYNHTNRQCIVGNIAPNFNDAVAVEGEPNLIQISSPQQFFLLSGIEYQYTGEKRCRDRVWCHVWIGEKKMENNTVQHRELYWASSVNGEPIVNSFPVKLIWKTFVNEIPIQTIENNYFNFRRHPRTIFEIDFALADCYRALGAAENYNLAVLSFKIGNDKKYPVFQNLNFLRLHIFETLMFTLFVRPIRISNLIVDQADDDIIVTFTLLDVPPKTGPVENPIIESPLERVIERFDAAINSNSIAFRARYGSKQVTLRARPDSLNIQHRSSEKQYRTTGPTITGLWIGFTIVGLAVGVVGGFFLLARLSKS